MAADILTLTLDPASPNRVTVKTGRGRVYYTSAHALGTALIAGVDNEVVAHSSRWIDCLASHGIAILQEPRRTCIVGTIPAKTRMIGQRSIGFPAMFGGISFHDGALFHAVLCLADLSKQPTMTVTGTESVLFAFPYGNVYTSGRVCWGTVPTRGITSLTSFEHLFFTSGFNTDLANAGSMGGATSLPAVPNGTVLAAPTSYNTSISRVISTLLNGGN